MYRIDPFRIAFFWKKVLRPTLRFKSIYLGKLEKFVSFIPKDSHFLVVPSFLVILVHIVVILGTIFLGARVGVSHVSKHDYVKSMLNIHDHARIMNIFILYIHSFS